MTAEVMMRSAMRSRSSLSMATSTVSSHLRWCYSRSRSVVPGLQSRGVSSCQSGMMRSPGTGTKNATSAIVRQNTSLRTMNTATASARQEPDVEAYQTDVAHRSGTSKILTITLSRVSPLTLFCATPGHLRPYGASEPIASSRSRRFDAVRTGQGHWDLRVNAEGSAKSAM